MVCVASAMHPISIASRPAFRAASRYHWMAFLASARCNMDPPAQQIIPAIARLPDRNKARQVSFSPEKCSVSGNPHVEIKTTDFNFALG